MKLRFSLARLLLAMNMVALLPLNVAHAQGYVDPSVYTDAVMALSATGVIDGGGNVRLNDYVNRAEALKIILKAQQRFHAEIERTSLALPPISLFPDVKQQEWYAPFIEVGFKFGLIKGFPNGLFWPSGGVRVSEAASMLVRSYGLQNSSGQFLSTDHLQNQPDQWYSHALSILNQRGAVTVGSRLQPADYMTRGNLINMVYRMQQPSGQSQQAAYVAPVVSVNSETTSQFQQVTTQNSSLSQFASKKNFAITIPSLGIIDLTITHPNDPYTQKGVLEPLVNGVGHLFSYPGQGGKIMVYGHSSGYPWDLSKYTKIFRTINQVNIGDRVYVTYEGKLHVYQVSEKKTIPAKDKAAFEPDEHGEELVLYTCWPPDSIANRYLVYAKPIEEVAINK